MEKCAGRLSRLDGARLCRTAEEFRAAENAGLCAAVLGIEGAEVLDCDPRRLLPAAELGVKIVGPTWNIYNGLCGTAAEQTQKGLTPAGREFCAEAVRLGMKLDASHASEAAVRDMLELFPGNVFASHSNAYALCSHPRNISDGLFRAIAASGGVTGINLYTPFLGEKTADVSLAAEHIVHFSALSGDAGKHIALGCDFDGCGSFPAGINGSEDVGLIAEELSLRGFDRQGIIDIFHDNLFGFIWERQDK